MEPLWKKTASKVQEYRAQSLRKVQPPLPEIPVDLPKDVTYAPQQLLSPREIAITDSSPESLLSDLTTGKWSSYEVTQAYIRRAALAQELVGTVSVLKASTKSKFRGQLHHRVAPGASAISGSRTRSLHEGEAEADGTSPRSSDQCKGAHRHERTDLQRCLRGMGRQDYA